MYNSQVIITKNFYHPWDKSKRINNMNTIVFGDTASGKTRNIVEPNILQANTSFVITDVGGKLHKKYTPFLAEKGYRVITADFRNKQDSNNFTNVSSLSSLTKEKTALFIIYPTNETDYTEKSEQLFTKIFHILYSQYDKNGEYEVPVHFLIDDAANIGTIPELEKRLAVMNYHGLAMTLVFSRLTQLQALYSEWGGILANCDIIVLTSPIQRDIELHEFFLKRNTINSMDSIISIRNNECIVFVRSTYPYVDEKYNLSDHPNF